MHVVTLGQKKSNANLIRISYREVGTRHAIISISSLSIDAEDLQSLVATSEPILRMIAPCRLPSQNRIYMAAIACLLKFANPDRGGQIASSQQKPVNSTAAPSPPGSSHGSTWTTAAKPTPASSSPITTATNNGASKSLTSTPRKPRTSSAHSRQAATPLAPAPSSLPCSEASGSAAAAANARGTHGAVGEKRCADL